MTRPLYVVRVVPPSEQEAIDADRLRRIERGRKPFNGMRAVDTAEDAILLAREWQAESDAYAQEHGIENIAQVQVMLRWQLAEKTE